MSSLAESFSFSSSGFKRGRETEFDLVEARKRVKFEGETFFTDPEFTPRLTTERFCGRVLSSPDTIDYQALYNSAQAQTKYLTEQLKNLTNRYEQLKKASVARERSSEQQQFVIQLFSDEIEQLWYTERPFPAFTVALVDRQSLVPVTHQHPLKVKVSLIDARGTEVPDGLSCKQPRLPHQPVEESCCYSMSLGQATISGLRFRCVSSKFGGYFQIVVSLVDPNHHYKNAQQWTSPRVQILSYRLYHTPKVALDKLQPSDRIYLIKGIGEELEKRLQSIGIFTVQQLAEFKIPEGNDAQLQSFQLGKNCGSINYTKLLGFISQAREIMDRCNGETAQLSQSENSSESAHSVNRASNENFEVKRKLIAMPLFLPM